MSSPQKNLKENVHRFDEDVQNTGSYAYTGEKLSSQLANARISKVIYDIYDFKNKRVLDLGCGDGVYSMELLEHGATQVLGIDPAKVAVEAANKKASEAGVVDNIRFEVGNIYELEGQLGDRQFDCVVLRGVLHHLPDPAQAVAHAALLADSMIILEPNGFNPVLKLLEKFSKYHVEHEERSFFPGVIRSWVEKANMRVVSDGYHNLVPMFCPDWMAKLCKTAEPMVENIPLLREIGCGQYIALAEKR